ncbi:MAG TPA: hypothetical protein VJK00_13390, partial [Steroidobacteraceae bacterium]|nr:hypothetical protein [Steroidobacteraceae bacterium]
EAVRGAVYAAHARRAAMKRILGLLGAVLGGWLGWWLGARLGLAVGILLSVLTSGAGMYLAYRWYDENLD